MSTSSSTPANSCPARCSSASCERERHPRVHVLVVVGQQQRAAAVGALAEDVELDHVDAAASAASKLASVFPGSIWAAPLWPTRRGRLRGARPSRPRCQTARPVVLARRRSPRRRLGAHALSVSRRGPEWKPSSTSMLDQLRRSPARRRSAPARASRCARRGPPRRAPRAPAAPALARGPRSAGDRAGLDQRQQAAPPARGTAPAAHRPAPLGAGHPGRAAVLPARAWARAARRRRAGPGRWRRSPASLPDSPPVRVARRRPGASPARRRSTAPGSANWAPPMPSMKYPRRHTPSVSSLEKVSYSSAKPPRTPSASTCSRVTIP